MGFVKKKIGKQIYQFMEYKVKFLKELPGYITGSSSSI